MAGHNITVDTLSVCTFWSLLLLVRVPSRSFTISLSFFSFSPSPSPYSPPKFSQELEHRYPDEDIITQIQIFKNFDVDLMDRTNDDRTNDYDSDDFSRSEFSEMSENSEREIEELKKQLEHYKTVSEQFSEVLKTREKTIEEVSSKLQKQVEETETIKKQLLTNGTFVSGFFLIPFLRVFLRKSILTIFFWTVAANSETETKPTKKTVVPAEDATPAPAKANVNFGLSFKPEPEFVSTMLMVMSPAVKKKGMPFSFKNET